MTRIDDCGGGIKNLQLPPVSSLVALPSRKALDFIDDGPVDVAAAPPMPHRAPAEFSLVPWRSSRCRDQILKRHSSTYSLGMNMYMTTGDQLGQPGMY